MDDNNKDYSDEFEQGTVTLFLDDGKEVECGIVAIFPANGKDYIALLPLNDEEAAKDEVYLYRYIEKADNEPELENITDENEYEIVVDAFDELMDEDEYDELEGNDDGNL